MSITLNETYHNFSIIEDLCKVDTRHPDYDNDRMLYPTERKKLRDIVRRARNGVNTVEYRLKPYKVGRYYPKDGRACYQSMYNVVRRLVLDGKATSIDGVNIQPTLLNQLVKRYSDQSFECLNKYVTDREACREEVMRAYNVDKDTSKKLFIRMCFGGSPAEWLKQHVNDRNVRVSSCSFVQEFHRELQRIQREVALQFPNYKKFQKIAEEKMKEGHVAERTQLALYLQDQERLVMEVVYRWCVSEGFTVRSLIHDEVLVDHVDEGDLDLTALSTHVHDKTGYTIVFESKQTVPSEEDMTWFNQHKPFMTDDENMRPDVLHSTRLLELFEGKAFQTPAGNFMYDEETGLWVHRDADVLRVVQRHGAIFQVWKYNHDEDTYVPNNSRPLGALIKDALPLFWCQCPKQSLDSENNKGYLLFDNGVLDGYTSKLLPFDAKYHFTRKIHYVYDPITVSARDIEQVVSVLFDTAYTKGDGDFEKRDYFLEKLSRAIFEGGVDKEFIVMLGETNSGKGALTLALGEAFMEYVETFSTSVLLQGSNANLEDARKWTFLAKCYDARLMIGNEISMGTQETTNAYGRRTKTDIPINVDMVKMLVSGGDKISCRLLYNDPVEVANQAFVIILANDIPYTKADKAYANRQILLYADRSSSSDEQFDESKYFAANEEVKTLVKQERFKKALVGLMCQYYRKHKHSKTPMPEWVKAAVDENVCNQSSWDWVLDNYEVYPGSVANDFGTGEADKDAKGRTKLSVDLVGDWFVRSDKLFEIYKENGGRDGATKFGRTLSEHGILPWDKKMNGKTISIRVGLRIPQRDVAFREEEEDSC